MFPVTPKLQVVGSFRDDYVWDTFLFRLIAFDNAS